jgi:hypothetical protein
MGCYFNNSFPRHILERLPNSVLADIVVEGSGLGTQESGDWEEWLFLLACVEAVLYSDYVTLGSICS